MLDALGPECDSPSDLILLLRIASRILDIAREFGYILFLIGDQLIDSGPIRIRECIGTGIVFEHALKVGILHITANDHAHVLADRFAG